MNRELRKRLCVQPMVDEKGSINHAYFADVPGAHWSTMDQEMLLKGIEKYGVGKSERICENMLPGKSPIEIRLRTCMLLGVHKLEAFEGVKEMGQIEEIKRKNLAEGKRTGKLKFGVYFN
jgi:hypothetical protein